MSGCGGSQSREGSHISRCSSYRDKRNNYIEISTKSFFENSGVFKLKQRHVKRLTLEGRW